MSLRTVNASVQIGPTLPCVVSTMVPATAIAAGPAAEISVPMAILLSSSGSARRLLHHSQNAMLASPVTVLTTASTIASQVTGTCQPNIIRSMCLSDHTVKPRLSCVLPMTHNSMMGSSPMSRTTRLISARDSGDCLAASAPGRAAGSGGSQPRPAR